MADATDINERRHAPHEYGLRLVDRVRGFLTHDPDASARALSVLFTLSGFDGDHHKTYAIDQAVRALTGENYPAFVADWCKDGDTPGVYEWDEGVPP